MSEMTVFFFLLGTVTLITADVLTEIGKRDIVQMKGFPLAVKGFVYSVGLYMIILNISMNATVGFLYAEY